MSSTLTPSSMARKARNRAVSRMPACPITRCGGKPVTWKVRWTMASSGLLTTITTAWGLVSRIRAATSPTILAFVERRSSRLMPGLRAMPAVTTTTSLPAVSAQSVVPVSRASKPMIGAAWKRSRALPAGIPSVAGMSRRTTSPSSAAAHQWAVVAPTLPAPMMEIFARRMAGGIPGERGRTMEGFDERGKHLFPRRGPR